MKVLFTNFRYIINLLLASLFVAFLSSLVSASEITAPVVSILAGDTIAVLHSNRAERVRLNGIDCSEKGQAFGKRAKQAASELVFGKEVKSELWPRPRLMFEGVI